jgi:hypothetical protein
MWSGRVPMVIHKYIFWMLLILTCGYALWRGRKYEQLAAIICIAASVISVLARSPLHQRYAGVEVGDLVIDSMVLVSFVVIALRSDRFWPLWIAGLQLTISMSHLFKAFDASLIPIAYAAAERFWSYPTLIIIAVGAWRQHRRHTASPALGSATPA